jgi:ABC-type multidrug transport system permease subunit
MKYICLDSNYTYLFQISPKQSCAVYICSNSPNSTQNNQPAIYIQDNDCANNRYNTGIILWIIFGVIIVTIVMLCMFNICYEEHKEKLKYEKRKQAVIKDGTTTNEALERV